MRISYSGVTLLLIVAALTGCASPVFAPQAASRGASAPGAASASLGSPTVAPRSLTPRPTESDPRLADSQELTLTTPDGVILAAREFGSGRVGVVLAHYADENRGQIMWYAFSQVLRQHGYRALTFDFRGYCPGGIGGCSKGVFDKVESWRDLVLAVTTLRARGVDRVFVMGAGLGGHTALWAAAQLGVDFAGVVAVSAPQVAIGGPPSYDLTASVLHHIAEPKLFIAGAEPSAEARSDAQAMYRDSKPPKELKLLVSAAAGPELFTTGTDAENRAAENVVLDFLASWSS